MKGLNFKKLISPLVPLGAILIIISSCYPNNGTVYPSSLDTVLTLYDESVDFTQYKTYALPDSIVDVGDPDDRDYVELTDKFDDDILNKVKSNLDALGYTQEPNPETNGADVFIFVSKVASKNYEAYSWWGYWGWYPGWGYYPPYGPGWNPWYPWGGSTVVYTYTVGSILIDMFDPEKHDEANKTIGDVWRAGINGQLDSGSSDAATLERLNKNIDQAFEQSQYLKTN